MNAVSNVVETINSTKLSKGKIVSTLQKRGDILLCKSHSQSWNEQQTNSWSFRIMCKEEFDALYEESYYGFLQDFEYISQFEEFDYLDKWDIINMVNGETIDFYCDTFGENKNIVRRG
jgi:hypothetical protein